MSPEDIPAEAAARGRRVGAQKFLVHTPPDLRRGKEQKV